jgi:hypothetical protein
VVIGDGAGLELRLFDPRTGRWLPTQEEIDKELETRQKELGETEKARRQETAARLRAEEIRRQAQAEIERLRRENAMLRKKKSKGGS